MYSSARTSPGPCGSGTAAVTRVLLDASAQVTVLVTSRLPLSVPGEHELPVRGHGDQEEDGHDVGSRLVIRAAPGLSGDLPNILEPRRQFHRRRR